ncbi:MAG: ATP-binding protein [Calditrichaeota bacterium]|nr:MAG: ATP-binding protein [Calditrichota bacterium]MBL1204310.1 ATP-binding protein [Calditrichota bacterium]NOG44140.1 ATP-binding protein [Calditrichota bacterium]
MKKMRKYRYKIRFPSRTDNLEVVRDFVHRLALKAGFVEEGADQISLAVDEACTNVIKHAHNYNSRRMIDLSVNYDEQKFEIVITDKGKGFDPKTLQKPDLSKYIHEAKMGGLGIHLMKTLMDEVNYSFNPGIKNQVSLIKYIKTAA